MYKTEMHLHTQAVSACCDCPPEDAAACYLAAGYTTIVVTDHLTPYAVRREGSYSDTVDWFLSGYEALRDCLRDRIHVLFGFELRFDGYANDYLVYGLDAAFLRGNRDLPFLSRRAAIELIHEAGGMIFAAHPFRDGMTVFSPDGIDGVEVFNANQHESRNELAFAYARRYALRGIAGTDFHHAYTPPKAGITTPIPITCNEELLAALRDGCYRTFCEAE